jgi:hypothetical protein
MRIKKRIIQILFITLVVLHLIAACSIIRSEEKLPIYTIDIDPAHKTCQQDDDCALVYIDCSSCDCGEPVNINFEEYYHDLYLEICRDYSGPVCEMETYLKEQGFTIKEHLNNQEIEERLLTDEDGTIIGKMTGHFRFLKIVNA